MCEKQPPVAQLVAWDLLESMFALFLCPSASFSQYSAAILVFLLLGFISE